MQQFFHEIKERIRYAKEKMREKELDRIWGNTPEWLLLEEVSAAVFSSLENATIDFEDRQIIWSDHERRSITLSLQHLKELYSQYPVDCLNEDLLLWLYQYDTPHQEDEELPDYDELLNDWIEDYQRGRELRKS